MSVATEKFLARDYWSFETSYERSPVVIDGYDFSGDKKYNSILLTHLPSEGLCSKFTAEAPGVILWFIDATRIQESVGYINQKQVR